jgi:hypothetical protein
MLAARAKVTQCNLFPLCSRTTQQLTLAQSMNKRHRSAYIHGQELQQLEKVIAK